MLQRLVQRGVKYSTSSKMTSTQLQALAGYSAYDVSDALLKLGHSHGGYLADILPRTSPTKDAAHATLIAPASTYLFVPKSTSGTYSFDAPQDSPLLRSIESNVPAGTSYADLGKKDTVALLSQPKGQTCAVMGGIMAKRMAMLGVRGVLCDGRVRDLGELERTGLPVWSKGLSTVGQGGEAKAWAYEVPIVIGKVVVSPGDIVFADPSAQCTVCIPQDQVGQVLELMEKLTKADELVMKDVENGSTVSDAFKKHRGK